MVIDRQTLVQIVLLFDIDHNDDGLHMHAYSHLYRWLSRGKANLFIGVLCSRESVPIQTQDRWCASYTCSQVTFSMTGIKDIHRVLISIKDETQYIIVMDFWLDIYYSS